MGTKINNEYAVVAQVLDTYYDGLFYGDTSILRRVFHPDAHYVTVSDGKLLQLDMDSYLPIVEDRESPERLGDPHGYILEAVEFAGPITASARMRSSMMGKHFIDFLLLIKIDGEWRIISKVFHHERQGSISSKEGE